MWIFLLQFCKFSAILWSNLFRILDFDRNNLFTHFCFSELLNLKEKISSRIFKKYWNNTVQDSCTKKVQCCTRCRKSHFFWLTLYSVYVYYIYSRVLCWNLQAWIPYLALTANFPYHEQLYNFITLYNIFDKGTEFLTHTLIF